MKLPGIGYEVSNRNVAEPANYIGHFPALCRARRTAANIAIVADANDKMAKPAKKNFT